MSGFKCNFCRLCDGYGCISEMPGMGGPMESKNFILNCEAWKKTNYMVEKFHPELLSEKKEMPEIRLGPMTGAVENVGYHDEKSFYFDLISACHKAGVKLSIGDGCPDEKLYFGIQAVENLRTSFPEAKAAVFIKPYSDEKILGRYEMASHIADGLGIDIDAYNIITMRKKVSLEKKNATQLKRLKEWVNAKGLPFIIKGIFTDSDLELVREVKPDVAFISNHGGRVETRIGSTADFLWTNRKLLSENSGTIWVDGGIRTASDAMAASLCGATTVLIGRPFASALCRDKENGPSDFMKEFLASSRSL